MKILEAIFAVVFAIVFPPRDTELLVRAALFEELEMLASPSAIKTSTPMVATALLPYRAPLVQAFILEAKFHNNKKAHEFLGRILAAYIQRQCPIDSQKHSVITLIPLPLGKARRRERGYNQVEEVAKCAQRILQNFSHSSIPISLQSKLLMRVRDTTPQMTLARAERLQNMHGAFAVNAAAANPLSPDHTYIVLDDVLTTGATISAACEALLEAGATKVLAIALAH